MRVWAARLAELQRTHAADLQIVAETDKGALAFYVANGFAVRSLGRKYPGVERISVGYTPITPCSATGHVILLNGPSSSGKSTITAHLLPDFNMPSFHMPIEHLAPCARRQGHSNWMPQTSSR